MDNGYVIELSIFALFLPIIVLRWYWYTIITVIYIIVSL